jgi:hypothetical protein
MKQIMHATLERAPEWFATKFRWSKCRVAAGSCAGDGDLQGYLARLNLYDQIIVSCESCAFAIYDIPQGALAVVDVENEMPYEMYWVVDVEGEWFFPDDEYVADFFGSNDFVCCNRESIASLARGWDVPISEIMEHMHEATFEEISRYGVEE